MPPVAAAMQQQVTEIERRLSRGAGQQPGQIRRGLFSAASAGPPDRFIWPAARVRQSRPHSAAALEVF